MSDQGQQPEADPVESITDLAAVRREAAARRVKLRETEQERDTLRERVDAQDRQTVEGLVADRLADPADFWQGTQLDDLRGEDGLIDVAKAEAATAALLAAKPHYAKQQAPPPPPDPASVDLHNGRRETDHRQPQRPSFGEAMRQASRRRR